MTPGLCRGGGLLLNSLLEYLSDGTCTMDSSSAFYSGQVLVHVDMGSGLDETLAV